MRGISTSSVITSGLSCLIFSRATYGSAAVPTISISRSRAEHFAQQLSHQRGVVDDEELDRHGHRLEQIDLAGHRRLFQALAGTSASWLATSLLARCRGDARARGRSSGNTARAAGRCRRRPRTRRSGLPACRNSRTNVTLWLPTSVSVDSTRPPPKIFTSRSARVPPALQNAVDQLFHRGAAVARRLSRDLLPGVVAAAARPGQHEVIHAADAEARIADAGRDAGAEHGIQDSRPRS